jgi:hypothetical protein
MYAYIFYRRIMVDVIALSELLLFSNDTSSILCFLVYAFVCFLSPTRDYIYNWLL